MLLIIESEKLTFLVGEILPSFYHYPVFFSEDIVKIILTFSNNYKKILEKKLPEKLTILLFSTSPSLINWWRISDPVFRNMKKSFKIPNYS